MRDVCIFSVWDSAAALFLEPFVAPTVEFALREFKRVVNSEGHQMNQYPSDYTLFYVGKFDQSTGKLEALEPTSLGVAVTLIDQSYLPEMEDGDA